MFWASEKGYSCLLFWVLGWGLGFLCLFVCGFVGVVCLFVLVFFWVVWVFFPKFIKSTEELLRVIFRVGIMATGQDAPAGPRQLHQNTNLKNTEKQIL